MWVGVHLRSTRKKGGSRGVALGPMLKGETPGPPWIRTWPEIIVSQVYLVTLCVHHGDIT